MQTIDDLQKTPLLEWIPNISTGDAKLVGEVADIFHRIPGVYVLHIDRGPEVNRTVFTLVGTMPGLRIALLELMEWSDRKLDMGLHRGTHPRLGALDVSPFVLFKNANQEKALSWIRALAREVAERFQVPMYLYEQSARQPNRINLAEIRRGEYEGLEQKLLDPAWKPDYGQDFNSRLGATVIGLRDFLVAYNVNLGTPEIGSARTIAGKIRSSGPKDSPYRLPGLKALGWFLEKPNFCQVSTNITQTRDTTPLEVYEQCKILGNERGIPITGSELIGLIPWHSVKSMLTRDFTTISLAQHLGLEYCGIRDLKDRVIEYKVYLASGKTIFNEIFESR